VKSEGNRSSVNSRQKTVKHIYHRDTESTEKKKAELSSVVKRSFKTDYDQIRTMLYFP